MSTSTNDITTGARYSLSPSHNHQSEGMDREQALANRQRLYLEELGRETPSHASWFNQLTQDQQLRVGVQTRAIKHGLHAVAPLTCKGPHGCPFLDACPIPKKTPEGLKLGPDSDYPIGMNCILEGEYMAQKIADYVVYLGVDPGNPIELAIVNELALIDLKKNRALMVLSHGDRDGQGRDFMHVDESITGFTEGGTPLISKTTKLHPVAEFIDKLERRREKWLDRLMETRKSKADFAVKIGNTDHESKILVEIQNIRNFVESMQLGISSDMDADMIPALETSLKLNGRDALDLEKELDSIGLDEDF